MITILILTAIWISYTMLGAYTQAHYYDLYPSEKKHRNLHPFYVIERMIILFGIWQILPLSFPLWDCIIFIFALCFIYSFFHNGLYYWTRNKLNPSVYPKKWKDSSTTSEALFEVGFGMRTAMMLIGFLLIAGVILENT